MWCYLLAVVALMGGAFALEGKELAESIANNMEIRVGVVNNHPNENGEVVDCSALGADWALCGIEYINVNYTGEDVSTGNWSLYFHSIRRLLDLESDEYELTFITGDLHKITPSANYTGLKAGLIEFKVVYEYWIIFDTDFIPRYWIEVDGDADAVAVVPNTDKSSDQSSFVDTISGENWRRTLTSVLPKANLSTRYEKQTEDTVLAYDDVAHVIVPTPLKTEVLSGVADLSAGIVINASVLSDDSVEVIYDRLEKFGVEKSDEGYPVTVSVSTDLTDEAAKAEGYTLVIEESGATVVGYDKAGAFYGLQSLVSLVKIGQTSIPCVSVVDAPYIKERRQHVDFARNFHGKELVFKILDQMAAYKLNMFHFHLSDDEGWRIEIPGLSELTSVGSKRCHDLTETKCLLPMLGSGPTKDNSGTGYFTRDEYIEILKYANARYIEVFPEFDMPGHSRAAVVAMEARYRKYAEQGDMDKANQYRLLDPDDTSEFLTVQFYGIESQINSCMPGAVRFARKLIKEMVSMHNEAGIPLTKWHFGADEAKNILLGSGYVDKTLSAEEKAGKGQIDATNLTVPFGRSPICQEFFKENNMTSGDDLIPYLAIEVSKILADNGIDTFMAWQDGMVNVNASDLKTANAGVNFWDTLFWGGAETWVKYPEKGFKVTISIPDFLYLDFPYENNVNEQGYYWAGRDQSVYRLFTLAPLNLAQNAETSLDRDGFEYNGVSAPLPAGSAVEDLIVGISGQLWTEIVRTDESAEYMMFPRLLALAERAWHKASWELDYVEGRVYNQSTSYVDKDALAADWNVFSNVVGQRELPKLGAADINYRVPVPGAVVEDGVLKTNIDLPGVPVWKSTNGKDFKEVSGDEEVTAGKKYYIAGGYDGHLSRVESLKA